jgi:hypothetical protein
VQCKTEAVELPGKIPISGRPLEAHQGNCRLLNEGQDFIHSLRALRALIPEQALKGLKVVRLDELELRCLGHWFRCRHERVAEAPYRLRIEVQTGQRPVYFCHRIQCKFR